MAQSDRIDWILTVNGRTMTLKQWEKETGISYNTIKNRMRQGLTGENIFAAKPIRPGKHKQDRIVTIDGRTQWLSQWADECDIDKRVIYLRYERGVRDYDLISKQKLCKDGDYDCKETLCIDCGNYWGGCSWSRSFVPVSGWVAKPTIINENGCRPIESYEITACPEFISDTALYVNIAKSRR